MNDSIWLRSFSTEAGTPAYRTLRPEFTFAQPDHHRLSCHELWASTKLWVSTTQQKIVRLWVSTKLWDSTNQRHHTPTTVTW